MNQDFRDLLAEFNARKVEFLVVGAHALAAHGCVRATRDLDVWVRPQLDNAKRVMSALRAFGSGRRRKPRVIPTVRHACYASAVADVHSYHLPFSSPANRPNRPNPKRSFLSRFFSQ